MKLIAASGSPGMQRALTHPYVHTIVDIFLHAQDNTLLTSTLLFLKTHIQRVLPEFEEDLQAFVGFYQRRPGTTTALSSAIELQQIFTRFYQQSAVQIQYQRGAILEVLVCKLVRPRYQPGECLGNQRFMDDHGRPITDQVDVAALSHTLRQLEGYECKLKVDGIESADCTNLAYLAAAASAADYRSQVGIVALDNLIYMRRRLSRLQPDPIIKLYGLDNIAKLADAQF